jgi:NADH:ubiquinone oxidoreductase subunit 4 (subunit M)
MLLLLYGLLSGMLLYYGYYGLYVQYGVSDIGYSIGSKYVMISVMMSGGVKLAMYPVNVWLSKVHVESPTVGSVLLAGISLKTGYYVQYEMISSISKISSYIYYYNYILIVGLILYNIVIFYQIDTKRWIALYSILHINLYYLSLFTQPHHTKLSNSLTSFHTYQLFGLNLYLLSAYTKLTSLHTTIPTHITYSLLSHTYLLLMSTHTTLPYSLLSSL